MRINGAKYKIVKDTGEFAGDGQLNEAMIWTSKMGTINPTMMGSTITRYDGFTYNDDANRWEFATQQYVYTGLKWDDWTDSYAVLFLVVSEGEFKGKVGSPYDDDKWWFFDLADCSTSVPSTTFFTTSDIINVDRESIKDKVFVCTPNINRIYESIGKSWAGYMGVNHVGQILDHHTKNYYKIRFLNTDNNIKTGYTLINKGEVKTPGSIKITYNYKYKTQLGKKHPYINALLEVSNGEMKNLSLTAKATTYKIKSNKLVKESENIINFNTNRRYWNAGINVDDNGEFSITIITINAKQAGDTNTYLVSSRVLLHDAKKGNLSILRNKLR